ncbi:TMEM14 family protein [Leptolyngbya sp. FACHB-321]|uniref:TMEM14 family protein n=1 Tax=Leptolyngbya sp. FACHB-321 TaxID=2692807 RepID=UPI001F554F92|nr:TMEM14 family protein [Leptolyngbya sp. FACHB-321]
MASIIWLILVYALLVAIGGVIGYVKAKSNQSLISGLGSGVALAIAWYISLQNPTVGLALAAVIALALLVVFALRFRATGKFMPAGLLAILSLVMTVLFVTAFFLPQA